MLISFDDFVVGNFFLSGNAELVSCWWKICKKIETDSYSEVYSQISDSMFMYWMLSVFSEWWQHSFSAISGSLKEIKSSFLWREFLIAENRVLLNMINSKWILTEFFKSWILTAFSVWWILELWWILTAF